jgi:hypothetical protein
MGETPLAQGYDHFGQFALFLPARPLFDLLKDIFGQMELMH